MREGKRVLGTSGNPITGLVKRHADHKNSREVMRGLCQTHRACPFGRGGGRGREGQEREDNRFVHLLRPPPQLGCVHPDLSRQWKAPPPLPPQCDKISLERVRWCNYTPPPTHTSLYLLSSPFFRFNLPPRCRSAGLSCLFLSCHHISHSHGTDV